MRNVFILSPHPWKGGTILGRVSDILSSTNRIGTRMRMNGFDFTILSFLNTFVHRSWIFDAVVVVLEGNRLLKGGLIMALFCWAWIKAGEDGRKNREILLYGMLVCAPTVLIARGLALLLPFRIRPLHNPELHYQLAYTLDPNALEKWSSFPSDHATLYFALAITLFFVSRRWGGIALLYVFFCHLSAACISRIALPDRYYRRGAPGNSRGLHCAFAMAQKIDRGHHDAMDGHTPGSVLYFPLSPQLRKWRTI